MSRIDDIKVELERITEDLKSKDRDRYNNAKPVLEEIAQIQDLLDAKRALIQVGLKIIAEPVDNTGSNSDDVQQLMDANPKIFPKEKRTRGLFDFAKRRKKDKGDD